MAANRPVSDDELGQLPERITVGQDLKNEYGLGYHERLRLEVAGDPQWEGEQGRLDRYYDEVDGTLRAIPPVTVTDHRVE